MSDLKPPSPSCRCCHSPSVDFIGAKAGRTTKSQFDYFFCRACDFTFVSPVTPPEIYNEDYYKGTGIDPYVNYVAELGPTSTRSLEFDDIARILAKKYSPGVSTIRWLDYGCGTGSLLRYFDGKELLLGQGKTSVTVEGCDVGSYAEKVSAAGYRVRSFDELEAMPQNSFDIISAIEVLEHIAEPDPVISLIGKLLKPGGLLILTTGNMASPVARFRGLKYRYLIPEIHVSLFSPRTLELLYARHGLAPVNVAYRGVVKYKILRSLLNKPVRGVANLVMHFPFVTQAIDLAYGVSAMPWGRKIII